MAEVKLPKQEGGLTREHSSLEKGKEGLIKPGVVEHKEAVIIQKKSFGQKLRETFIAEDARDVGDYILWDILVPTIKRTIRDIIVGSTDRIFLGTSTPSSNLYRERGVTMVRRTDYASKARRVVEESNSMHSRPTNVRQIGSGGNGFRLNEWTIKPDEYEKASLILDKAIDYLDEYGKISVDEYYQIVEEFFEVPFEVPYTAQNWGWKSLNTASIITVPDGYMIKLPQPIPLKA